MTDTKKTSEAIIPIVTKPAEEIIPTPAQQMIEDSASKKKIIYHQPPRKNSYAADKARYNELCGDSYKITLGYPMTWAEFNQISDSMKKDYIESMMEKYPGISYNALAYMFNVDPRVAKFEVNRLGICINGRAGGVALSGYKHEIDEIKAKIEAGESPRNLQIVRKEDLSKLKRKHYKQVKAMDPEESLKYINGIYERYSKTLSIGDFADMMGCSKSSVSVLFKEIGFKFNNVSMNFCRSKEAIIIRSRFREEMIESGNSKKFVKRKYNKSKNEEESVVETVISEPVDTVADTEPADDTVMVETRFVPMAEVPAVEFYDPASVMDSCIPADREIEDHDPVEKPIETVTEPATKPDFNITSIDAEVDVDKISEFIKYIGFTGKVKIHIEKI